MKKGHFHFVLLTLLILLTMQQYARCVDVNELEITINKIQEVQTKQQERQEELNKSFRSLERIAEDLRLSSECMEATVLLQTVDQLVNRCLGDKINNDLFFGPSRRHGNKPQGNFF